MTDSGHRSGRPVRVALVSPRAVPGGAQRLLATVLAPLTELGVETHLVLGEQGALATWAAPVAASVTVVDRGDADRAALAAALREIDPEVVWSEGASGHCWAGAVAAAAGVPAVWWRTLSVTGRPTDEESAGIPAAAIACLTTTACSAQRVLTPTVPVVHIPGAIPEYPSPTPRPEPGQTIGIVSRIDRIKGHDTFLDAAALLAASHPQARFVVVGGAIVGNEGDLGERLRARAVALGLGNRVVFTGHVDDPAPLLGGLDVLVSASREESFGLSVVEAMAARVPVVATNTEGPVELLEGGSAGLIVDVDDPTAMATAVARCLDEPDETRARVERAWQRSRAFTPAAVAARWSDLLHHVARGTS